MECIEYDAEDKITEQSDVIGYRNIRKDRQQWVVNLCIVMSH